MIAIKDDLVNKWGGTNLRNIYIYNETNYIHPDDWGLLENYPYISSLHQCIKVEEKYIVLEFFKIPIRVDIEVFFPLKDIPFFKPMENVKFHNTKGIIEYGIIKGIHWHNNQMKFYYDVEVNGKMKTKRYYDEDLERKI